MNGVHSEEDHRGLLRSVQRGRCSGITNRSRKVYP
jgi:hypothetical protein